MVAAAEEGTDADGAVPELRPWREAGWIFRNGDAVAVERRADRLSRGTAPAATRRDESSGR